LQVAAHPQQREGFERHADHQHAEQHEQDRPHPVRASAREDRPRSSMTS
jgi:hypothetical protein